MHVWVLSHFSHVRLFETPWTAAHQAPLSMGILQSRILEWVAVPSSRGSSRPRDGTCGSYDSRMAGGFFTTRATWETPDETGGQAKGRHFRLREETLPCACPWGVRPTDLGGQRQAFPNVSRVHTQVAGMFKTCLLSKSIDLP